MNEKTENIELERLKREVIATGKIPAHVAVIMDGNGRWAKRRDLPVKDGHSAGVKSVKRAVIFAREIGIKVLTLYTFSRQNWKRSLSEIAGLMSLLSNSAYREVDELIQNGVKLIVSGDIAGLPLPQRTAMELVMRRTSGGDKLIMNLALNYGGREEIVEATRKISALSRARKIKTDEIVEKLFEKYIYTAGLPDPDLIIRTSGEMRISNFLLWQSAYSEFYVTDALWPDFDEVEFCKALLDYASRERRYGGRTEE